MNALLQQGMTAVEIKKYITEVAYKHTEVELSKTMKKNTDTLLRDKAKYRFLPKKRSVKMKGI